jgi:hypothetical protein
MGSLVIGSGHMTQENPKDDEHGIDPRINAVGNALLDTQESWVSINDGTVTVDMDEVSRIAVFAVESVDSEDHCKWMCHVDEQDRIVEILREAWKATKGNADLLSMLVDMIEIPDGLILTKDEEKQKDGDAAPQNLPTDEP